MKAPASVIVLPPAMTASGTNGLAIEASPPRSIALVQSSARRRLGRRGERHDAGGPVDVHRYVGGLDADVRGQADELRLADRGRRGDVGAVVARRSWSGLALTIASPRLPPVTAKPMAPVGHQRAGGREARADADEQVQVGQADGQQRGVVEVLVGAARTRRCRSGRRPRCGSRSRSSALPTTKPNRSIAALPLICQGDVLGQVGAEKSGSRPPRSRPLAQLMRCASNRGPSLSSPC